MTKKKLLMKIVKQSYVFGPENGMPEYGPFSGLEAGGGSLCRTPAALPAVSTLHIDSRGFLEGSSRDSREILEGF